jgi:hypothetical protein
LSQNDVVDTVYSVTDTLPDDYNLFTRDEVLDISLSFDIKYYKKKRSDEEYLNAVLTYYTGENDSITRNIKLRSRGIFRREYCDFPPLMLNFRAKEYIGKEFNKINKLKMVTVCKKGQEDYLLREYLVYKLYNILTDYSFKVRLLRINYIDTGNKNKSVKEFAFAIEPVDFLSERLYSLEIPPRTLHRSSIKPEMFDRMAIFNYMIGNGDWAVGNQHNVVVLQGGQSDRPDLGICIPYDFDYSGIVNTDYAVPGETLGIKSVRERVFLGLCREKEDFEKALKEFSDKKDEMYQTIRDFPWLSEKSKNDMIKYLDSFYKQFDKRNSIVNNLLYDCRTYGQ